LRHIKHLFADGAVTGLSDSQLLERFVAGHDAAAFEALVAHHGPIVLSVCRSILNDPNDAEDVMQATFLGSSFSATSSAFLKIRLRKNCA
jgi:Sigma-70 region 2